jgi:hypothetical protein
MKKAQIIGQVGDKGSKWQLKKLTIQFWLTKDPFDENIFNWGKEIQFGWVMTQREFRKA